MHACTWRAIYLYTNPCGIYSGGLPALLAPSDVIRVVSCKRFGESGRLIELVKTNLQYLYWLFPLYFETGNFMRSHKSIRKPDHFVTFLACIKRFIRVLSGRNPPKNREGNSVASLKVTFLRICTQFRFDITDLLGKFNIWLWSQRLPDLDQSRRKRP